MKRSRIINTLLVPASDLVGNEAGFLQCQPVQQRADFRRSRRVRESLVGDRTDDLMSKRAVRVRRNCKIEWRRKLQVAERGAARISF